MSTILFTTQTTPASPTTGKVRLFIDSVDGVLKSIDSFGVITPYTGTSDEHIQDVVGALISAASPKVVVTYNDLGNVLTIDIDATQIDHTQLQNIGTNTHAQIDSHIANTSNPHSVTKAQVGLGNVDNTSDANKPISTATQTALNAKENSITAGTTAQYWRGDKTFQTLDKTAVGLSNVDNTSDANKPISTATQTALNAKVDANSLISPSTKTKVTFDAKGLIISATDANLDDLGDVIISSPILGDVLKYNGTNWVNGSITTQTSAGSGVDYFLSATPAGITGYDLMSKTPDAAAEVDESISITSSSGHTLFESYVSDVELGHSVIDGGIWNFNIYNYVSAASGTTYMTLHVYKRTSGGTETQLFQVTLPTIAHTSAALQTLTSVQPSFACNPTDKLVFKFYVDTSSGSSVTVHLVHSGTSHYSFVETPLVTQHDDLAGLQGGTTNQFYHLTSSEYAGTGSGNFVRESSPHILTPTGIVKGDVGLGNVDNTSDANKPISTATQTALNAKENSITAGTTSQYWRGDKTFQTLDKTAVGLSNVDNTSDANKPISTATQTALNAKENSITAGTTSQYWRGDKTFQTLDKTAVGLSNVDNTADTAKSIAGDVTGTLGASTVTKIQNRDVATTAPANGQSLSWNSSTNKWEPQTVGGSGVTTITTAASVLNLSVSSSKYQLFVGTVHGQSVVLPDATTLTAGADFFLANKSDTIIPVFYNGGALACFLYPDQYIEALVLDTSTAAGKWIIETATPNPLSQIAINDDFINSGTTSGAIGQLGWTVVTGTTAMQASTGSSRGVVRLSSSIANNGTGALHLGLNNFLTTGGAIVFETRVQFPTLGGATAAGYTARFGLGDTTGNADQANGIYFEYAGIVAGTVNWSLKTASANTRTTTATSVAVAATTYYKLAWVLNAAGTSVGFYINGTYINSIATNIPAAAIGLLSHITTNATNAAAKSADIDYVYMTQNFNTVR